MAQLGKRRLNCAALGAQSPHIAPVINGMELVITANAGSEDKLFGSVGPVDITEAFAAVQVEVQRSEVRMPDGPIHELGDFQIGVHLHPEVNAEISVKVVAGE